MRALTILQPWASFIPLGVKSMITQDWNTNHRGTIAIHASPRWDAETISRAVENHAVVGAMVKHNLIEFPPGESPKFVGPMDAIVTVCDLKAIQPTDLSGVILPTGNPDHPFEIHETGVATDRPLHAGFPRGQIPFDDFSPGRFVFFLNRILVMKDPIPCRRRPLFSSESSRFWALPSKIADVLEDARP